YRAQARPGPSGGPARRPVRRHRADARSRALGNAHTVEPAGHSGPRSDAADPGRPRRAAACRQHRRGTRHGRRTRRPRGTPDHPDSTFAKGFPVSFSGPGFGLIQDIDVRLTVELGRVDMCLRDVLALGEESVVMLDRLIDEPLEVKVNGKLIARGEVVSEGNRFGLRIIELVGAESPTGSQASADKAEAPVFEAQA